MWIIFIEPIDHYHGYADHLIIIINVWVILIEPIDHNHEYVLFDMILFDLILYVHSTILQLCGTGLPGLNQY